MVSDVYKLLLCLKFNVELFLSPCRNLQRHKIGVKWPWLCLQSCAEISADTSVTCNCFVPCGKAARALLKGGSDSTVCIPCMFCVMGGQ